MWGETGRKAYSAGEWEKRGFSALGVDAEGELTEPFRRDRAQASVSSFK
jgi:hypothetical protein